MNPNFGEEFEAVQERTIVINGVEYLMTPVTDAQKEEILASVMAGIAKTAEA